MQTNNSKEKVRQLQNKLYLTAKKCDSRRFHALYDKVYRDDVLFEAFVIVRGKQPKAKGRKNDLLILVQEEPDSNEIIYVNQLCVDGIRHKENEWYGIAD